MSIGFAHGLWTLSILIIFIAIVAYVWSSKKRSHFEEAGRIPLEEDRDPEQQQPDREQQ